MLPDVATDLAAVRAALADLASGAGLEAGVTAELAGLARVVGMVERVVAGGDAYLASDTAGVVAALGALAGHSSVDSRPQETAVEANLRQRAELCDALAAARAAGPDVALAAARAAAPHLRAALDIRPW